MATKLKLTRPELKRQRDSLARFERYLPMLKLKQQQLQMTIQGVNQKYRAAEAAAQQAQQTFDAYRSILIDVAGLDIKAMAAPSRVLTATNTLTIRAIMARVFLRLRGRRQRRRRRWRRFLSR
jgi:vacuolar-type H+-ATPase subunit D/Vma8